MVVDFDVDFVLDGLARLYRRRFRVYLQNSVLAIRGENLKLVRSKEQDRSELTRFRVSNTDWSILVTAPRSQVQQPDRSAPAK